MTQPVHPRDAMLQLMDFLSLLADNAKQIAEAKHTLYKAYMDEGFTEQQALELVKGMTGVI